MNAPVLVKAYQVKSDGTLGAIIPKALRERLGIVKGSRLLAYEEGGCLVMRRLDTMRGYASVSD